MRQVQKWNPRTKQYSPHEIPDDCVTITAHLDDEIQCAQCYEVVRYGDCFTSKQIHTKHGMGYAVCEECYDKEVTEEYYCTR